MAPAPSKRATPATIQPKIAASQKRKASRISDNSVSAKSTKHLKQSADAAQAVAVKHQKRQPSVQDDDDNDEDTVPLNNPPKKAHHVLEAANGSDDDIEMLDNDPAPKDFNEDEPEVAKPNETAEKQLSEST